jgi:excisionase family DNA binding protein
MSRGNRADDASGKTGLPTWDDEAGAGVESDWWPLLLGQLLDEVALRAARIVLAQLAEQRQTATASPFLTIPEAAEYACCKRQRIDDLLSAGLLTRYKDGRRTLVSRAELDTHIVATTGPRAGSISPGDRATVTNPDNRNGW